MILQKYTPLISKHIKLLSPTSTNPEQEKIELSIQTKEHKIPCQSHTSTLRKNFNILYPNMRSILNKTHLLEELLEEKQNFKAAGITKSWLSNGKIELIQIT